MHFKPELEDDIIKLVKLDASHEEALFSIAFDADLWQYSPTPIHTPEDFHLYFQSALSKQAAGEHFVYVVLLKAENKIIGSTRYYDIAIPHRTLSMGYSWLVHVYQGSGLNTRMKYLLIAQAFAEGVRRITMTIDSNNKRSRKANEKCGFRLEGIMRKHMLLRENRSRDTAVYALLDDEWPEVRQRVFAT